MSIIKYLLFLLPLSLLAKPTICLNMIVKDEEAVIERCLQSVKPYIDTWVIVDTGSSDRTMELIEKELEGIPGELHQTPWVDFAHCRNIALKHAEGKSDYLFFIDADEVFKCDEPQWRDELTLDNYLFRVENHGLYTPRLGLIKNSNELHWEGAIHERLENVKNGSTQLIESAFIDASACDGARNSNPNYFLDDIELLEKLAKKDPSNPRHAYYLGQTYTLANEYRKAIDAYLKFAQMGGEREEVFAALFAIAQLKQKLDDPLEQILHFYSAAIEMLPHRAEPYYEMALLLYELDRTKIAYLICKKALNAPLPTTSLYVKPWVYHYGLSALCGACAFDLGLYEESLEALELALSQRSLIPDPMLEYIENIVQQIEDRKR